ncbi:hypothetical protein NA57DRAFT_54233 [Rhizodiscina lignyota]|uniref:DNA replication regulator SLD2 n=1 Tax=Rhizodiscina lignyota TaxID=1504668 RepID=A0A9P4IPS9_9PEZI|nr:hypothetical protein NA57DRAFT_54233 [Rhizodiscina lignyota]
MPDIKAQLASLKDELKVWEKNFANANGGRKPTKGDIKADPAIAQKYKEYNKLRDPKISQPEQETPKKRKSSSNRFEFETPRRKVSKGSPIPEAKDKENDPAPDGSHFLSPTKSSPVTAIGPTPQKDGAVLGLFDNIPSTTPRKQTRTILSEVTGNIAQTPSRKPAVVDEHTPQIIRKRSRTPISTGKRFLLDTFATPTKRKLDGDDGTPNSSKRLKTPSFLRRCSVTLDTVAEEEQEIAVARPWQRRSFGRSLSSMIQEMRKKEDDQFEDELEVMREMEDGFNPTAATKIGASDGLLLGEESDNKTPITTEGAGGPEKADTARKPFKKKGQKRQTRRVIMRPVRTRPEKKPEARDHNESDEDDYAKPVNATEKDESDYGSFVDDDSASSGDERRREQQSKKTKGKETKEKETKEKEARGKKKINPNATAHANFRSLKIKNKNSKAKGRGRMGRR